MFRVLIVDDERIILNGCRLMITELLHLDFPVQAFTAESVEKAKEVLKNERIDLILVDIRMPVHDGFELASYVNELETPPDLVILTSHASFDYAQKSIRHGVRDFLLKPIDEKQLQEVIIASHMRKQQREEILLRSQFQDIISMLRYDLTPSELMMSSKNIRRIFPYPHFQVIVLQFDDLLPQCVDYSDMLKTCCPIVQCFEIRDRNQVACVCNSSEPEMLNDNVESFLVTNLRPDCKVAVSCVADSLDDLHRLYVDAQQKLFYRRMFGKAVLETAPLCSHVDCMRVLFAPSGKEIRDAAEHMLAQLHVSEKLAPQAFRVVYESFRQNLILYFTDTQLYLPEALEKSASIEPASPTELTDAIVELTLSVCGHLRDKETNDKEPRLLAAALDYIRTNYTKDLSLDDLADAVKQHPNFICALFRRQTKKSYLYFLHQARIQAAKHFLLQTAENMETIAEKIGYNSATQFTRVFRKYESMTPAEYRRLNH